MIKDLIISFCLVVDSSNIFDYCLFIIDIIFQENDNPKVHNVT